MPEASKAAAAAHSHLGAGWENIWKARLRARANLASNMLDARHRALATRAERMATIRNQISEISRAVAGDDDEGDDVNTPVRSGRGGGKGDKGEDPRP